MMDVVIIAIGKIKNNYYAAVAGEYLKRLRPYARVKVRELKAESFGESVSSVQVKRVEGERIIKELNKFDRSVVYILDEQGVEVSSVKLAQELVSKNWPIVFVLGGALGLSKEVINYRASRRLALSQLTFPHELARVILLEQLYRVATINQGKVYHY